jgi:hypothetical protein
MVDRTFMLLVGILTVVVGRPSLGLGEECDPWEVVRPSGSGLELRAVAVGPSQIVAVGEEIVAGDGGPGWVSQPVPVSCPLVSVAAGPESYVAVGFESGSPPGTSHVVVSTDAATWIEVPTGQTGYLQVVGWVAGAFVSAGFRSPILMSADGQTWTSEPDSSLGSMRISDVMQFRGELVIVGTAVEILGWEPGAYPVVLHGTLPDLEWEMAYYGTPTDPRWASVDSASSSPSKMVIVASSFEDGHSIVLSSSNLHDWTKDEGTSSIPAKDIAWNGASFIAVGGTTDAWSASSRDGVVWTVDSPDPTAPSLWGVTWDAARSQLVAVGEQGAILRRRCHHVLVDGFETGDLSQWSMTIR